MPMMDTVHNSESLSDSIMTHAIGYVMAANESIMRHILAAINIYVEINYFILK